MRKRLRKHLDFKNYLTIRDFDTIIRKFNY